MRTLRVSDHHRNGEKGFTLIELLVVVTIIGILAAIVSVSVGGFTGKASVQAHKSTIQSVQAAVDAYIADHYSGSGAVVPPTMASTVIAVADQPKWYDTNGTVLAADAAPHTLQAISMAQLTQSALTTIGNTARTQGPYLRLGGNAALACVFVDAGTNTGVADGQFKVLKCTDTAQTAQ